MAKLPYMKFFHADWLTDTQPLSPAARGIWIDLICLLWRTTPRGSLTFSKEQWCRMLRCDVTVLVTVLEELESFAICDIEKTANGEGNGKITISSRRIVRDEKDRLNNNLRQSNYRKKLRSNDEVTDEIRKSNPYISDIRSHSSDSDKNKIKTSLAPKTKAREAVSTETWNRYSEAYLARYKTLPVRNHQVNSQLKKLVELLGAEEAPHVAAFYLTCTQPIYLSARHPTNLLLRDATGLRTQWKTNTRVTRSEVKTAETQASVTSQLQRILTPSNQQTIDVTPTKKELTHDAK